MDGHDARRTSGDAAAVQGQRDRASTRAASVLLVVPLSGQLAAA
jgi:hypothetical protein